MQNTKQKKKVSYDDILASLKMSVNGNGKLEIVRTDADETKLKDQLVQKYTKPVKPNNSRPGPLQQQQQQPPNRSNAAKPQFNRPVTRTPIKPMPQSFIHAPNPTPPTPPPNHPTLNKTKANYLASYFSKDKNEEEVKEDTEEVKLKIVELDEEEQKEQDEQQDEQQPDQKEVKLTEEEQQELEEQYQQYRENYRQHQEYNKAVILYKINQHNERVMNRRSKSKKLLFATSNIRISPSPMNSLFGLK